MFYEGERVTYMNHKECQVVGVIIPNTIYEIKDLETGKVLEVSGKDIEKIN